MPLHPDSQTSIEAILQNATGPDTGVPGLVFCVIDKNGSYLTQTAVGKDALNADRARPMSMDTVFWIASCTKMIVGLAAMQLVEQGRLDLDSSDQLYKVCPELQQKQVWVAPGKYEPKQREITMKMLLNHTAGFGYTFFDHRLKEAAFPLGWDEFTGDEEDIVDQPLVNQPGSQFQYSIGIDWAGIAIMRLTGQSLQDYCSSNIFEPLGIQNVSFVPTQHMRDNLVTCSQAQHNGKIIDIDHPFRRAIFHADRPKAGALFQSGGAGCLAKPKEYCQILATLLNNGTSPTTGKQILKPETVDTMFENTIPQFPQFANGDGTGFAEDAKPFWSAGIPNGYPQEGNPPQGWGLTFLLTLNDGATGRAPNTAHWSGIT